MMCTQVKQSKNNQSKNDTGVHADCMRVFVAKNKMAATKFLKHFKSYIRGGSTTGFTSCAR